MDGYVKIQTISFSNMFYKLQTKVTKVLTYMNLYEKHASNVIHF